MASGAAISACLLLSRARTDPPGFPSMPLTPGARLGPYEVSPPTRGWRNGEVYRARDTRLIATLPSKSCLRPSWPMRNEWRGFNAKQKSSPR